MTDEGILELVESELTTKYAGVLGSFQLDCAGANVETTPDSLPVHRTATELTEEHWLRCRKLLDDYRTDCVACRAYAKAAEATSRLEQLERYRESWRRDILAARCLQERRSLGAKQQHECEEFTHKWKLHFAAFREKARTLREDLRERHTLGISGQGRKQYGCLGSELPPGWDEESEPNAKGKPCVSETKLQQDRHEELAGAEEWEEEDEEESHEPEEGDEEEGRSESRALEALEQLSRECDMHDLEDVITCDREEAIRKENGTCQTISDPTLNIPAQIISVRAVRSARSMELRYKAKKLAGLQRYAEAANFQAQAKHEEDGLYATRLDELAATKLQGEERQLHEMHRLEGCLRDQEMSLQDRKQKDEQLVLKKHARQKEQLVSKQCKAWHALGGKTTQLEEVLRRLARPKCCGDPVKTRTAPQRIAAISQQLDLEHTRLRQSQSVEAIRRSSCVALPKSKLNSATAKSEVSPSSRPASTMRCCSSASLPTSKPRPATAKGRVSASSRQSALPSSRPHSAASKDQLSASSRPASAIRCSSSSTVAIATPHSAIPKGQVSASSRPASAAARHRVNAVPPSRSKDQARCTLPVADPT
eukprot:TRINITY_DN41951_c0_g1_i1.p1 TRINITY_DN41951_c0_g1~~TRINITY_DN41951_c0_g1_i1.p1  ORF type:complete len:595 (+),score=93.35 TRINITY_DN41951_c0_g1_i1:93-1877(+)